MAQLYFYYSAMNAGKSTSLLQSAHNYREQGMDVVLYTAALDDRFAEGRISSRIGLKAEALTFDDATDFFSTLKKLLDSQQRHKEREARIACVLLDEAQFLSRTQVDQLARIVDELNIPVLCYGIRTDFQGELFAGSERLLAMADKLKELKTVCRCGRKATMTVRVDEAGNPVKAGSQVEIGGNSRYESKCRRHYHELMNAV